MARPVKIFAEVSQGSIFFFGSRVPAAPLGGAVLAIQNPNRPAFIRVTREDKFQRDGVTPRRLYKRLNPDRVKNKEGQFLVGDLGFSLAQVVDYINDQANKKSNEIDFQNNGSTVGGGTTINFTGNIDSISISGDVATVAISTGVHASQISGVVATGNLPITSLGGVNFVPGETDTTPAFDLSDAHSYPFGISTSGGHVGSGVTLFDFRGSGVSTVTSVTSGISTVFFKSGTGNPITSGAIVGAGSTTLRLTLEDSSVRDIDVTSMRSTTSIGSSTAYFLLNNGAQLSSNQHDKDGGVVFYGTKVKRGEELVFTIPSGPLHVGIWNGGNGVTGISSVSDKSNWSTKFRFSADDTRWNNANMTQGQTGIDLATPVETDGGSYSIRFNYDSQKLELYEIDTAFDWKIATANVALGVTETYIYFSTGSGNSQSSPPESLPGIVTHRSSDYVKVASINTAQGPTIHHGVSDDDVWKSNQSLRPGMKIKFTVPEAASNQYWATGYEGTDSQSNAYTQGTMTWRLANTERIIAYHNTTRNDNYTAAHDSASSDTYGLAFRNLSWRYNTDNSWDLFDEDTDEVILTGDTNLDGGDMYPHLLAVTNGTSQDIVHNTFQWEWNAGQWFTEYRDYESGGSGTTFLSKIPNGKPLKTFSQALPTQSGGFYYLGNAVFRVTWGEKMRPGQEFSWTQLADNSNGATKNNMIIGVLNSDSDAFTAGIRFNQTGTVKEQTDQDSGFTLSAGISTATTTAGASMRLRYEHGTNKLVCDRVVAGVRTKIAESTSALDGNPIFISMGGESTRIPTTQGVSVYGWEFVHTPTGYYNPWNNWRVGGFPANVVGLTTGNHSTAVTIPQDTVLRHKDGLAQGYQMKWTTPVSSTGNPNIGQWKTTNAASGITDVDNPIYWDWRYQTGGDEDIDGPDMVGMTINTSNSNYVGGSDQEWRNPNPGTTQVGFRYHSNNTIDFYDFTGGEIIATVDATQDGNPVYISRGASNDDINTAGQFADDFFSGGNPGIALTTN